MNIRRIVLLAVVVAVLALYYNIKEVKIEGEKQRVKELKARLFGYKKGEVAEFRLEYQDKTVRIVKKDKGWRLVEPLEDSGDKYTLDNMAANITNSITLRTLIEDPAPENLAEYGLDNPYMKVFMKPEGGDWQEPTIIGDLSPFGSYVYVIKPGDKTVYLVNTLFRKGLDKSLYSMRNKTILDADFKALSEFAVVSQGGEVKLEKEENGLWKISAPRELAVDDKILKDMFKAFRDSKIKKFVEEKTDSLEKYGFGGSHYEYTFSPLKNGSTATLLIGKPVEGEDLVYAKFKGDPKVFALGKDLWDKMPKSLFDLRYKRIVTYSNNDIEKISIESKDGVLAAEQYGDDEWKITSPRDLKASYYAVKQYLYIVKELEATRFFKGQDKVKPEYGFQSPYLTVKLWPVGAKQPITLTVGAEADKKLGRYAMIGSTLGFVTIPYEAVEGLILDVNHFRDKHLATFHEAEVKRIVMKFPETGSFTLERKSKDKWRLVDPVKSKVDMLRVKSTIWRLEALTYNDIISEEDVGDEASYGFDQPRAHITLWGEDEDKPLEIFTLGSKALKKDNIYIRVESLAGVFTTDADILERIPKTVEDMKRRM